MQEMLFTLEITSLKFPEYWVNFLVVMIEIYGHNDIIHVEKFQATCFE